MRKSTLYLGLTVAGWIFFVSLLVIHPHVAGPDHQQARTANKEMVRQFMLTDLCLFTESRYTRHLSQADLHSAFQDHPFALEHFPSGSLTLPPRFSRDTER